MYSCLIILYSPLFSPLHYLSSRTPRPKHHEIYILYCLRGLVANVSVEFVVIVQVNRRGETMNIHKQPTCVTIGICATNPSSPMPYGMLLAHTVPVSPQENVTNFQKFSEQSSQLERLALSR